MDRAHRIGQKSVVNVTPRSLLLSFAPSRSLYVSLSLALSLSRSLARSRSLPLALSPPPTHTPLPSEDETT